MHRQHPNPSGGLAVSTPVKAQTTDGVTRGEALAGQRPEQRRGSLVGRAGGVGGTREQGLQGA